MPGKLETSNYGTSSTGQAVTQFTCTNDNGLVLQLLDYGATMTALKAPDNQGNVENITLSCPDIAGWESCETFFGATVGRFCNRIRDGRFTLDGHEYQLAVNNGAHHLHGGLSGLNRKMWKTTALESENGVGVNFSYTSADGEESYPGNLTLDVTYSLNDSDEMLIQFQAVTDAPTPVNLTNHSYWNLGGRNVDRLLEQEMTIHADQYVEVDERLIPTGEMPAVKDTPLDFTEPKPIGRDLHDLIADPPGYDHCYILRNTQDNALQPAARVCDPHTGRVMEVFTTQPGIQFYTGNFLDGSEGSGGFPRHSGFCLETQHYPDSPNMPAFPNTILRPGEKFRQQTVHKFSVSG